MTRPAFLALLPLLFLPAAPTLAQGADEPASRWWEAYAGEEANGPKVLGFWRFDTEAEAGADASSKGAEGRLAGAKWHPEGRFGGCLESAAGHPVVDERHAFLVPRSPASSPSGAFTLEMWLRPKTDEEFLPELRPVLADSKYTRDNHSGFQWALSSADRDGRRRFSVEIGLGGRSKSWYSDFFGLTPDAWHHVAFSYDGAGGVVFWLDGAEIGRSADASAAAMAAATRELSLGDRLGSNYHGFPGWIDEVRLSEGLRSFRPLRLETEATRPAFRRFDGGAALQAELRNLSATTLESLEVRLELPAAPATTLTIPSLAAYASHPLEIPLDASLRPGDYAAVVTVATPGWGGENAVHETSERLPFVVVPRPKPHRMPVVLWGLGGTESVLKEMSRVKDLGFTHCLGLGLDYGAVWEQGAEAPATTPEGLRAGRDLLDTALANDLGIVASVSPGRWLKMSKAGAPYLRVDREGRPYEGRADGGSAGGHEGRPFHDASPVNT